MAFGIDSWDGELQIGWGVTVVGPTRLLTSPAEVRRADELPLPALHRPARRCYVAIGTDVVHGWRIAHPLAIDVRTEG